MLARTLATGLWFLATWAVGGVIALTLEVPRWLMLAPAVAVAFAAWTIVGRYAAMRATPTSRAAAARVSLHPAATPTDA